MSSIRQLLDHLGHDALARLFQARALSGARADKDRRSSLARSYRGNVESFLHDLHRPELATLFAAPITFEGRRYQLPRASRVSRDQLLACALALFVKGRLPPGLIDLDPEETDEDEDLDEENSLETEDEDDEDDDDDDDENEDDEDDDDDDDETEDDEDEGPRGVEDGESELRKRGEFAGITVDWSRPRQLRRLLEQVSMEVPRRLTTTRFQKLRGLLEREGYELGSEEGQLYLRDSTSPGIEARVRLRLREISHPPVPPWSTPLPPPRPAGPRRPPPPPPPISPYERAWRRLELLTGIPDAGRPHRPGWPSSFVGAATEGVTLTAGQTRQLTVVAASYGMGGHNPFLAAGHLRDHLERGEWDALLDHVGRLNEAFPIEVAALREHIEQLLGPATPPPPAEPAATALAIEPLATAPVADPRAATPPAMTPVEEAPPASPPALNRRDLGLPGLFD
jgi:hypothetical protein